MLLAVLSSTLLLNAAGSHANASTVGWLPGWANRISLTIDHNMVQATLSNFPVLVHISASSGIGATDVSYIFDTLPKNEDRFKIAITAADGATQLFTEIEEWDSAGKQAWLWTKVPNLSSTADTTIYLYYDADQPDNTAMVGDTGSLPARKVWDNHFVMVQHLEQSGTPGVYVDSTAGHHDGTVADSTKPTGQPALIGGGAVFDSLESAITIPDSRDFSLATTGQLTISFWISPSVADFQSSADGFINFMGKGDDGRYEWSLVFYNKDGNDRPQRISFYLDNPQGGLSSGSYTEQPVALNEWVYITAEVDSRFTYIFRNGVLAGQDPYNGPDAFIVVHPQRSTEPLRIGTRNLEGWFQGRMDEVRISNVDRSDAWVKTSYYSDTDELIHFGEMTNAPPKLDPIRDVMTEAGKLITFTVTGSIPCGGQLVYSASNLPSGAIFDPDTHTFSWAPGLSQIGAYSVRFEVAHGQATDFEEVTLNIKPPSPGPSAIGNTSAQSSIAPTSKGSQPPDQPQHHYLLVAGLGGLILIIGAASLLALMIALHRSRGHLSSSPTSRTEDE